jgi:hypothetical protein
MTSPLTHEIDRTVAALAADTRLYPAVTVKSGVELQPQRVSRPQLTYGRSMCFTIIRPMYDMRKRGGVLAVRHVTGPKSRRMVWLEERLESWGLVVLEFRSDAVPRRLEPRCVSIGHLWPTDFESAMRFAKSTSGAVG